MADPPCSGGQGKLCMWASAAAPLRREEVSWCRRRLNEEWQGWWGVVLGVMGRWKGADGRSDGFSAFEARMCAVG